MLRIRFQILFCTVLLALVHSGVLAAAIPSREQDPLLERGKTRSRSAARKASVLVQQPISSAAKKAAIFLAHPSHAKPGHSHARRDESTAQKADALSKLPGDNHAGDEAFPAHPHRAKPEGYIVARGDSAAQKARILASSASGPPATEAEVFLAHPGRADPAQKGLLARWFRRDADRQDGTDSKGRVVNKHQFLQAAAAQVTPGFAKYGHRARRDGNQSPNFPTVAKLMSSTSTKAAAASTTAVKATSASAKPAGATSTSARTSSVSARAATSTSPTNKSIASSSAAKATSTAAIKPVSSVVQPAFAPVAGGASTSASVKPTATSASTTKVKKCKAKKTSSASLTAPTTRPSAAASTAKASTAMATSAKTSSASVSNVKQVTTSAATSAKATTATASSSTKANTTLAISATATITAAVTFSSTAAPTSSTASAPTSTDSSSPVYSTPEARADLDNIMDWAGATNAMTEDEKVETVAALLSAAQRYYPEVPTDRTVRYLLADINAESSFSPRAWNGGRLDSGASLGLMQVSPSAGAQELPLWQGHARVSANTFSWSSDEGPGGILIDDTTDQQMVLSSLTSDDLYRPWVNIHIGAWAQSNLGRTAGCDPYYWEGIYNAASAARTAEAANNSQKSDASYAKMTAAEKAETSALVCASDKVSRSVLTGLGSWVAGATTNGDSSYGGKDDDVSAPYFNRISEGLRVLVGDDSLDKSWLEAMTLTAGVVDYRPSN